jgi:TonB family protein
MVGGALFGENDSLGEIFPMETTKKCCAFSSRLRSNNPARNLLYFIPEQLIMKKNILTLLLISIATICAAQTSSTKYYKDRWGDKEVPQQKASFSKTITENADGSITKETKDLKSGTVITSSTYKGDEPFGVWVYQNSRTGTHTMDYNFTLDYSGQKCTDSLSQYHITDYFKNVDSIGYKAPVLGGGTLSVGQFLGNNTVYPVKAKEEAIQGEILLAFTITEEGNVENVSIVKGVHLVLDKEAMRVIRKMKFSSPALLNGHAQRICVTQKVKFVLV